MGMFKVEIEAVGGHGCQRDADHADTVEGCKMPGCPDCIVRECVKKLKDAGHSVSVALFRHWPGQVEEVVDNLLSKLRHGSFKGITTRKPAE